MRNELRTKIETCGIRNIPAWEHGDEKSKSDSMGSRGEAEETRVLNSNAA